MLNVDYLLKIMIDMEIGEAIKKDKFNALIEYSLEDIDELYDQLLRNI